MDNEDVIDMAIALCYQDRKLKGDDMGCRGKVDGCPNGCWEYDSYMPRAKRILDIVAERKLDRG